MINVVTRSRAATTIDCFGNPRKGIRGSIVKQNPVSDRDDVTFTVKHKL